MEIKGEKKKKAYKDMQIALELKEQQRAAELQLVRKEEAKFTAYAKELDSRDEAVKKERSEREEAKNKIF